MNLILNYPQRSRPYSGTVAPQDRRSHCARLLSLRKESIERLKDEVYAMPVNSREGLILRSEETCNEMSH